MTWQVTHTGSSLSGAFAMTDSATSKTGHGSISGAVTGNALHFTIAVPVGGFDSPYDVCRTDVTGDAQASASSIIGTYSGTNSCTGVIASGQLTLSKVP